MDAQEDIPELSVTNNDVISLKDRQESTRQQQDVEPLSSDKGEVVDDYTYLREMAINRNWEIPRERLEITEESLGGGEFGVVRKGIYLRRNGQKLPVAVKMLKGL